MSSLKSKDSCANLLDEITCSVCSEYFVTPTALNCSHVFCLHCIEHWKRQPQLQNNTLKTLCPICRKEITSQTYVLVLENMVNELVRKTLTNEEMLERNKFVESRRNGQSQLAEQQRSNPQNDLLDLSIRINNYRSLFDLDSLDSDDDLPETPINSTFSNSSESDSDLENEVSFSPSQASTITISSGSDNEQNSSNDTSEADDDQSDIFNDGTLFSDFDYQDYVASQINNNELSFFNDQSASEFDNSSPSEGEDEDQDEEML